MLFLIICECPWWDSNPRSPPYESGALPLSYRGAKSAKKLGFKILKIFQGLKRSKEAKFRA